jgi:hypothetical protein
LEEGARDLGGEGEAEVLLEPPEMKKMMTVQVKPKMMGWKK